MPYVTLSPRPLPLSVLVVKKGSKILARVASVIPKPESITDATTWLASIVVRTVRRPPDGIASSALTITFVRASPSS